MYKLIVTGPRRAVLAVHHCDSRTEVRELLAVYAVLGHKAESLVVEDVHAERAA